MQRLEDRALLAAVGTANLIAISDTQTAPFIITEHTRSGQSVQSFASQRPGGWPSGEIARDVAVTADGRIHVFNGTAAPYLSTLDPVTGGWTHTAFAGWSADGPAGAGGLAAIGNYVFASDSAADGSAGIFRFDTVTREAVRFATPEVMDVSVGMDGLLYTLDRADSSSVRAWDPTTLAQVRKVTVGFAGVTGVTADAAGNLLLSQWEGTIVKIAAGGTTAVDRLLVYENETTRANLTDIEIAADGTVIVGTYDGDVHVTDAATLGAPLRIPRGGTTAYVTFASPQFTPPPPSPAAIAGTAFADADGDGLRDASERGLAGATVYLDLDRDGAFDAGEPTAVTGADGAYRFAVEPGEYVVRQVALPGYEQTGPADFYYAASRGSPNRNAELLKIDAATGTATSVGLTGDVVLHGLVRTNDGRLFGINGFNGGNDAFYSVDPATGRATFVGSVGADLAWGMAYDAATDTIYGIGNLPGTSVNRLGTFNRVTGAFTPIPGGNGLPTTALNGTAGIAFDSVRRQLVVYEYGDGQTWRFTLDGTGWQLPALTPNLGLNLAFDGSRFVMKRSFNNADFDLISVDPYAGTWAKIGTTSNGFVAESLEFVDADGFAQTVTVAAGVTAAGPEFGNRAVAHEIRGTTWDDRNFNGLREPDEPDLGGVTVYLDLNRNGVFDTGTPQTTVVDPEAYPTGTILENEFPGTMLRAYTPQGEFWDYVRPLGQHATFGRLLGHRVDYGTEGVYWGGSFPTLRADFGTPVGSVTVNAAAFAAAAAAYARVRAYDNAGHLLADVTSPALQFGATTAVTVSGPGIAYVLVSSGGPTNVAFLIDGLSFTGPFVEPSTVSAADGSYSFTGLEPGTYFVGMERPRGWARSSSGNDRDVYWGLAYVPNGNGALKLVTVDPYTGEITWIGEPLPIRLYGLVRTNDGRLFGINDGSDSLYAVDPDTGGVTLVGPTGRDVASGLAYDPLSDTLYTIGRETTANGTYLRLLRLDATTGRATSVGPAIQTYPGSNQGPTNLFALTFDVATQRVVALDFADGEVYAWDWAGNGTLIGTSANVRTWALSSGLNWGSFVVQPHGTGNDRLSEFDPATGLLVGQPLMLSEPAAFESLDRNFDASRYVVRVDGVTSGVDFGVYDADWTPSAHAGGPYAIAEGGALTLDGSRSSDEDDDPLTYEWDVNRDGVVDATGVSPTLTWAELNSLGIRGDGAYTVGLRVRDPRGNSSNGAATLTVTNVAPVAAADAYATGHGATLTVAAAAGVLANDTDAGGDPLTAVLVSGPARGTLTLNADGSFTYVPVSWFAGVDSFVYRAGDGAAASADTTVTVTVAGPAAVVVDLLADEDDGVYSAGDLSLREAAKIVAAGGSITFAASLSGGTITLTGGEIVLDRDVTIAGLGAARLTVSGNDASRIFAVSAGASVAIGGLTLTGGRVFPAAGAGLGGAIDNRGTLALRDAVVTGNAAKSDGGGVVNFGTLTVDASTFTQNSASQGGAISNHGGTVHVSRSVFTGNSATWGGAIENDSAANVGGVLTVVDSTIAGNTASWGGGLYNLNTSSATLVGTTVSGNSAGEAAGGIGGSGILTLVNVTVSGNTAGGDGGGIQTGNAATLRNVTVFGNRAGLKGASGYSGGGIRKEGGTVVLHNTLIAGNLLGTGAGTADDVRGWGNAATGTNNLIADAASTAVPAGGSNGNVVGFDWATVIDPVLRDNGGPTKTHALLRRGRAVDAGNDAQAVDPQGGPLASDQRGAGFPRRSGPAVDVGAFELPNAAPAAAADSYLRDGAATLAVSAAAGVLANDADADGHPLAAVLVAGPAHGTLALGADGSFTYTPNSGYVGVDSFTYRASDGELTSGVATVTLDVRRWRFDFGTASSPAAAGYTRVTGGTTYSAGLGYGWASAVGGVDRGSGTDLTRDLNYTADGTFQLDLAAGTYRVTLTAGDAYFHDQVGVYLEGALADTVSTAAGEYATRSYAVTVSDGRLELRLRDLGGADRFAVINALAIEPAEPPDEPPPAPAGLSADGEELNLVFQTAVEDMLLDAG